MEGARLAAHDPLAGDEVGARRILALRLEHRLVEARRQHIDQVDVVGELAVLLARHPGRHEDSEMAGGLVNGVDDRLAVSADVVDVVIEVENPSERLLRGRDVVALGAEHDDRRTDVAQVDHRPVRGLDHSRRELVADEQLVDDGLDFPAVEVDVPAPPALEPEIARGLGVDVGVQVVLLGPQGVGGILVLEILHQKSAVELAMAEIAGERGEPAAAEQAARVAHRVFAVHAAPIGQRRPGDDDRAEQLGTHRREHHHGPAGLAVADHARLGVRIGMKSDHFLQEDRLGAGDVLEGLARHRIGQETDEIAGMAGLEGDADLAVGLEAADARPVPGARIDDDEGATPRIDLHARRRDDTRKRVVDRPLERAAIDHELGRVTQHVRRELSHMLVVLVAALPHHIQEQDAPLRGVDHVLSRRGQRVGGLRRGRGCSLMEVHFRSPFPQLRLVLRELRGVARGQGDKVFRNMVCLLRSSFSVFSY